MDSVQAVNNDAKLVALANADYSPSLRKAELRIIHDSVRPGPAKPRPGDRAGARHVRGDFIRWLINDARVTPLIYKDGLQVVAATIDGEVDLDNSHIPYNLTFQNCVFDGNVHFIWAETRSIQIIDSKTQGNFNFQDVNANGDLELDRLQSSGSITMYGAHIAGDLSMKNAKLHGGNAALYINIAAIKGAVYFESLECDGPLSMLDSEIGDQVIATRARFGATVDMTGVSIRGNLNLVDIQATMKTRGKNSSSAPVELGHTKVGGSIYLAGANLQCKPVSLSLANALITGSVYLTASETSGFHASGSVGLWQAEIKQILDLSEAELAELDCSSAQIGELIWAGIVHPENAKLTLLNTSVRVFQDVKTSWPPKGNLSVVGFAYEQTTLEVPPDTPALRHKTSWKGGGTSPDDRIAWLHLQADEQLSVSQPWMQLAQIVKARGNAAGAKKVLYIMERIQAKKSGALVRSSSLLYDTISEDPLRVLAPICLLWIFGSVIFWRARRMKAMAPTEKDAYDHFTESGNPPAHYLPFSPVVYTLENVLPVVNFGQDDAWAPNPQIQSPQGWRRLLPQMSYGWLAFLRWTLILLGWMLALILAGAIADRFKS